MDVYEGPCVYDLITKLCETTLKNRKVPVTNANIKRTRSKAYDILLGRLLVTQDSVVCLEGTDDPYCHLVAWQYVLTKDLNLREHAQGIETCLEALRKSTLKEDVLKNVLHVLVQLKNIPQDDKFNLTPSIENVNTGFFKYYDPDKFKLPNSLICAGAKYNNSSFYLPRKCSQKSFIQSLTTLKKNISTSFSCAQSCASRDYGLKNDQECTPSVKEPEFDLWETVSQTKFTKRRTWETLGDPTPEKEKPFASECPPEVCPMLFDLQTLQYSSLLTDGEVFCTKIITEKEFIYDMKNVLVGIVSNTFKYDDSNNIVMVPNVSVQSVSHLALKSFCKEVIFCGTCYKALSEMVAIDPFTGERKQKGYIFLELCRSIERYLSFYRVAALLLSDTKGLLQHLSHIRKLSSHLSVVSSVCQVGPFTKSKQIPHGVALLNYLYEKILGFLNKDVTMVLYSMLYPCLQMYFNRFLRQWILEGYVVDPYDEFFITVTDKYLVTRGRTYWTRSYTVREDIVPQFLTDLRTEILNCGKAMNLLKLCDSNSATCNYLMGKKPKLLQCCITHEQLNLLENNVRCYYLEVIAGGGPRFSMKNLLKMTREQEEVFFTMIAKKRAQTVVRIELEKSQKAKILADKQSEKCRLLREQFELAMAQKEVARLAELEQELQVNESITKMQKLEEKIIKEEAENMITYYDNLFRESDKRRESITKHVDTIKKYQLNSEDAEVTSSDESFLTVREEISTVEVPADTQLAHVSLDVVNANAETNSQLAHKNKMKVLGSEIGNPTDSGDVEKPKIDKPLSEAQKNKLKVMSVEMGIGVGIEKPKIYHLTDAMKEAKRNKLKVLNVEMGIGEGVEMSSGKGNSVLTPAQKNKLRVMSSEFDINVKETSDTTERASTDLEVNRNRNTVSNECFYDVTTENVKCDNENYINENVETTVDTVIEDSLIKPYQTDRLNNNYIIPPLQSLGKHANLKLDFKQVKKPDADEVPQRTSLFGNLKSLNFEFPKPMSVDSTPVYEFSPVPRLSERPTLESLSTAASNFTDEGFSFQGEKNRPFAKIVDVEPVNQLSREQLDNLSVNCLNYFLQQSVEIPLRAQTSLLQNELLKYFVKDLHYVEHLVSLRNYFFLLDGEFGRNITEGLFEKLYEASCPQELINSYTLKHLVFNAIDFSSKCNDHSKCLSFKINTIPKRFDLGDICVLDCLSLSYKVSWPLNIVLPSDTIAKYDEIFKFLLKLHRVSWVLKKIFLEMKLLLKQTGKQATYLLLSPQYRALHQYRHIMTHFVQTLQTYMVSEVVQSSWANFEENLESVTDLDQLYNQHTAYIKNILFMCLLNQRSAPIRKVINNIFVVILKFYDYLRSRPWVFDEDAYIHPNYRKLEGIFNNFLEFVQFLFKASRKVARVGYQPQLVQLVNMLDINGFYSKNNFRQSVN